MKLTKERILKIQAKLKAKHDAAERRCAVESLKRGWRPKDRPYVPREFRGFSIPYRPRLGIFKYTARSKNTFDPSTFEGRSYGHWCYVKLIKGKVVFNNFSYSNTTTGHQWAMRALLKQLGIRIDVEVKQYESLSYGLAPSLRALYQDLFQAKVEQARPNAKSRSYTIKKCEKDIAKIRKMFGESLSRSEVTAIQSAVNSAEARRTSRMQQRAAERKALRDRIKAIAKAEPSTLNARDVETETNSEVRRALVQRIGIARLLKELNAQTLDKQGSYELVDLRLANDNRHRPYLKMLNPSTGDVHVEGVPPHCLTVTEALAWRNQAGWGEKYSPPIKLT